jgi:hypothetical protein
MRNPRRLLTAAAPTAALAAALTAALLAGGCGEDPLGPDNRMAVLAFGKCLHAQALQLADNAIATGSAENIYRGLALKVAILRDLGDTIGAEALYPQLEQAWEAAEERTLTEYRRERDIGLFIDVARAERQVQGMNADCSDVPDVPVPE